MGSFMTKYFGQCSLVLFLLLSPLFTSVPAAASLSLSVSVDSQGYAVPDDFIGLSYGPSAIGDTTQLRPSDNAMLLLLRQIGPGIFRFGGNSMDNQGIIAFDSTKYKRVLDFVNLIGWKIMIGLPLGTFDTAGAKSIVKYVSAYSGKSVLSYEVGNEPDLYYRNGLRATTWALTDYEKEFTHYYTAIRRVVPDAPFSGPTTATAPWVAGFAAQAGSQIMLLTQHHYVEGPAGDPSVTIAKLLSPASKQSIVTKMNNMRLAAAAEGIPSRLAECNSVYSGGQAGVSDVFAAALWAADFMFAVANAGIVGVNFHGGGTGPYSPIADSSNILKARPEYYGIMLFKYAAAGRLVKSRLSDTTVNVGAYAVKSIGDSVKVVLINKDSVLAHTIAVQGIASANSGTFIRLSAPSLHSKSGITLGGDSIVTARAWVPKTFETVLRASNQYSVSLPKASAVVLTISLGSTQCVSTQAPVQKTVEKRLRMITGTFRFAPQGNEAYYSIRGERIRCETGVRHAGQPLIVERRN
jgi:hypothetical protein